MRKLQVTGMYAMKGLYMVLAISSDHLHGGPKMQEIMTKREYNYMIDIHMKVDMMVRVPLH